jgi:Sulfotransferase family
MQTQRPFFIFGCGRSGTSLLSRMLDAHSRIAVPFESHLYDRFYPLAQRYADLRDPARRARLVEKILRTEHMREWTPPPSLQETLAAVRRPDFHGIVEALLGTWTRAGGKYRWGEKTPDHTLWWRTILVGFPDLQVIHLIRDGRDVALSFRAAPFGPKHVYYQARRWIQYLSAAEEAQAVLGDAAFLTVRYEDLVAEPERELRRICAFLGEEFTPGMLGFYHGGVTYPTDRRNLANLRGPVLADNTQKWRTRLTPRELRIFEALAGAQLERYGYPRVLIQPRLAAWEALSCRYLENPPRRVLAMLGNRQGHRYALEMLRLNLSLRLEQ